MASVANKIAFFASMAYAQNSIGIGINRTKTPDQAMEDLLVLMEDMTNKVNMLENQHTDLLSTISTLETTVSDAESKQPLADYFWMNDS